MSYINPQAIYLITQENTQPAKELLRPVLPPNLDDNGDHKPLPKQMFLEFDQGSPFIGADRKDWREYWGFYCGLTDMVKAPADLDGESLGPLLRGRPKPDLPWREAVLAECYGRQSWRVPIRMVRTPRDKYVRHLGYGDELYDLERDPAELNNMARSDAHQELRALMSARLDEWIKRTGDPFESPPITDRQGNPIRLNQATSTHSSP